VPSVIAHIDTPTKYPQATLFKVSGWVASNTQIGAVRIGDETMIMSDRPDVRSAHVEYNFITGFSGLARESDIEGESLLIHIKSGAETSIIKKHLGKDIMLSLSKEEKFVKLKSVFPNDDPAQLIDMSRSSETSNDDGSKFERLKPVLKCPECGLVGIKQTAKSFACENNHNISTIEKSYVYLDDSMRAKHNIINNTDTASRAQDPLAVALIGKFKDGLILDCGAGLPFQNYKNVINFEIQKFSNTDVVGVGEELPFADNTFDAVFSFSVLEHVKDPFRCSAEIERVLKPGGVIYSSVPFLIPVHGYPHHYYNMTQQGLNNLFSNEINILEQGVPISGHPLFTLNSMCNIWNAYLSESDKQDFQNITLGDIIDDPAKLINHSVCASLPQNIQSLISCTNMVLAQKKTD
jgi:SAM-dependent methyltransferase